MEFGIPTLIQLKFTASVDSFWKIFYQKVINELVLWLLTWKQAPSQEFLAVNSFDIWTSARQKWSPYPLLVNRAEDRSLWERAYGSNLFISIKIFKKPMPWSYKLLFLLWIDVIHNIYYIVFHGFLIKAWNSGYSSNTLWYAVDFMTFNYLWVCTYSIITT